VGKRSWKKVFSFSVFSVAVTEKCCDSEVCGYGNYYFRSGSWASVGAGV
jgi:hypothetical protein